MDHKEFIGWRMRNKKWMDGKIPIPPLPTYVIKFRDMDHLNECIDKDGRIHYGKGFMTNLHVRFVNTGVRIHYWIRDGEEGVLELF